jgi:hypothetical protein
MKSVEGAKMHAAPQHPEIVPRQHRRNVYFAENDNK